MLGVWSVMNDTTLIIEAVEFIEGGDDLAADARKKYKTEFPGRSARRMTHLGMMVGLCLQRLGLARGTPIIYASAFAESESLEKFIDSFPQASPALFQSSIHPSAVEQALIPGKQVIERFYPIISDLNLGGKALENCFLLFEENVVLVGGEEKGTWLCPFQLASDESFAFSLKLSRSGSGVGRISLNRNRPVTSVNCISFPDFAHAIRDRKPIELPSSALDAWLQVEWL
jgi:hypothetical protein